MTSSDPRFDSAPLDRRTLDLHYDDLTTRLQRHGSRAIIFDCDGTLADSMPVHYVAWTRTLEPLGVRFDEATFYGWAGIPTDRILRMLAEEQQIALDAAHLAHVKEAKFLEELGQLKPIEPVVRLARESHGRHPIAVASGGFRDIVRLQLAHLGIDELFQVVVAAEDTERHKPEPDVFLEAARRLQVAPELCCVLEDSDLGIEAARRAGMSWIDVRPYHPSRD